MRTMLVCLIAAYLLGSLPFGWLIGMCYGVDIRRAGSGNIGATNVGRLLGRGVGVACFVLDAGKGMVAVALGGSVLGLWGRSTAELAARGPLPVWLWLSIAAAALLGHMFPVWLGFKGGKGVATGFGALLGMWPLLTVPALAALVTWLFVLRTWRYVSLASMTAALSLPAWTAFYAGVPAAGTTLGQRVDALMPAILSTVLLAGLVVLRHRANLARIRAGTEPRVGRRG
jgi:glycerol-3-phosphate acyltransferase PlsY